MSAQSGPITSFDEFRELWRQIAQRKTSPQPDPLLTDLARLLTDPRIPDAYVESVRSQLRETVYQLKAVAGEAVAA